MPFLLGKNGAIPFAPVNIYIENALSHKRKRHFLQQKWHFDESSEPQQQEKCS